MNEAKATAKYVRTSSQKAGLVMDLIRGKKAGEALSILRFTKKSVAREIEKALRSAIANAVQVADRNQKRRLDEDDLFVSRCYAGQGPSQKRVRPAPMGRAYRVVKRTAHLTVCVAESEEPRPAPSSKRAGAEQGRRGVVRSGGSPQPSRDSLPARRSNEAGPERGRREEESK